MSIEAIGAFFDRVAESGELKARVEAALEDRGDAAAFEIVDIAAAEGMTFTATGLRDFVAGGGPGGELSEAQMEAVAGGIAKLRSAGIRGVRKLRDIGTGLRAKGRRTTDPIS